MAYVEGFVAAVPAAAGGASGVPSAACGADVHAAVAATRRAIASGPPTPGGGFGPKIMTEPCLESGDDLPAQRAVPAIEVGDEDPVGRDVPLSLIRRHDDATGSIMRRAGASAHLVKGDPPDVIVRTLLDWG